MFETAEIRKNRKGNISYWENGVLIGKKCIECGEDKEISKFNFLNKAKGIYRPICNDCRHIQRKKCRDSKVEIAKIFIDGNEIEIRINKSGNVTYWEKGVMVGRKCTECGKDKKIDEFNFHSTKKGTYRSKCRECQNKYGRGYYKSNPDKAKEGQRKWKKNNTDRIKEHKKKSREKAKKKNLQEITNLVEQINPIFKQLNLPIYGYIYKFENVKTRHIYIGQSIVRLKDRYRLNVIQGWINHRKSFKNQKFLEELIEEDFIVTELFDIGCCQYHLDKLEAYYINKYNSCNNGYNNNAGNHDTDDGVEEFEQILKENGLQFINGKLIAI